MHPHREERLVTADGLSLATQRWFPDGDQHAAVVLVHGGGEHSGRYPHLIKRLLEQGFSVHAADLRGHGRSEGRRGAAGSFGDYLSDLHQVVATVQAAMRHSPVFLVGYSLGGLVSLMYALDHQTDLAGLVVAGPALGPGRGVSRPVFAAATALAAIAPRTRTFRIRPAHLAHDAATVDAYQRDPLVHHGRFETHLLAEILRAMDSLSRRLSELHTPLLVLHGQDDLVADPTASAQALQAAGSTDKQLVIYDSSRHDLFNDTQRLKVCDDVAAWIKGRC